MRNLYSKFFETGDLYDGLGKLYYARKHSNLSDKEMCLIVDELEKKGRIESSGNFTKKPWWKWNEKYVDYLSNGMSTGNFSRDYLMYFSKVRKWTTVKKISEIIVAITVLALIVSVVAKIIINHNAG